MIRVAVLLSLLALAVADSGATHCCSAEDRHIVERQWNELWAVTHDVELEMAFGRLAFEKLMEKAPETKALLKNVSSDNPNSADFRAHSLRVVVAIDEIINQMDDNEALEATLDHLADQHGHRAGVTKAHFKTFGQILLHGFPKIMNDFNKMSWTNCWRAILTKMASKLK